MKVPAFIASQPKRQREVMTILRSWIFDLGKEVTEQISHDVPTFYLKGALCYLSTDEDGIYLNFHKGYELPQRFELLESNGHKHVRSLSFYGVTEVEEHEEEVREILAEAAILNGYLRQGKKKSKN
jgi:hypothetical protein